MAGETLTEAQASLLGWIARRDEGGKGGGENAARLYGGMLESIREICGGKIGDFFVAKTTRPAPERSAG